MTGWRLGYLATPPGARQSAGEIPPALDLLRAALHPGGRRRRRCRSTTNSCRTIATCSAAGSSARRRLCRVEGIDCRMPDATFYLFPKVAGDDAAIAQRWLDDDDVAVLPGSAFGAAAPVTCGCR